MNLEKQVRLAIDDLKAQAGYPPHFVNAPHIREIGDKLESALYEYHSVNLRDDVMAFAHKMSAVMDAKEKDKGSPEILPISVPLMKLDYYVNKLKEFGSFNNPEEIRKTLIHIANFAMIAEGKIKT
jgi:hypothetical protein